MIKQKENTILREIPTNLLADEKVRLLAQSLQSSLDKVGICSERINYTTNIDNLDENVIDHLLWENHILPHEGLYLTDSLQEKRNLLKMAIEYHRTKGTKYAVEKIISLFFNDAKVREWFEVKGLKKFHFIIEVKSEFKHTQDLAKIFKLINAAKNKRSRLRSITFKSDVEGEDLNVELTYTEQGVNVSLIIAFPTGFFYEANHGHIGKRSIVLGGREQTGESCYRVTTNRTEIAEYYFAFTPRAETGESLFGVPSTESILGVSPFYTSDAYVSEDGLVIDTIRRGGNSPYEFMTKENNSISERLLFGNESNAGESIQLICGESRLGETGV